MYFAAKQSRDTQSWPKKLEGFRKNVFLFLIPKEMFLRVSSFHGRSMWCLALQLLSCDYVGTAPKILKMLTQILDITEQLDQSWNCLSRLLVS